MAYRGNGSVNGMPLRPFTTLFLEHGEDAIVTATSEVELIHFGLPDLRDMATQPEMPAVAADRIAGNLDEDFVRAVAEQPEQQLRPALDGLFK